MASIQTNSPQCDIRVYKRDAHLLLILKGSLVLQNSEKVRTTIHPHLENAGAAVDIYLGELGFIDSSGLGVLVGLQVGARKYKAELRLLAPTPTHMHLFEATRLNSVFRILDAAASATVMAELAVEENEIK